MMGNDNYFVITRNKEEAERLIAAGFELVSEAYGTYTFLDRNIANYEEALSNLNTIKTKMFSL